MYWLLLAYSLVSHVLVLTMVMYVVFMLKTGFSMIGKLSPSDDKKTRADAFIYRLVYFLDGLHLHVGGRTFCNQMDDLGQIFPQKPAKRNSLRTSTNEELWSSW